MKSYTKAIGIPLIAGLLQGCPVAPSVTKGMIESNVNRVHKILESGESLIVVKKDFISGVHTVCEYDSIEFIEGKGKKKDDVYELSSSEELCFNQEIGAYTIIKGATKLSKKPAGYECTVRGNTRTLMGDWNKFKLSDPNDSKGLLDEEWYIAPRVLKPQSLIAYKPETCINPNSQDEEIFGPH